MLRSFDNTEIAFKYRSTKELKQAQYLFATMSSQNVVQLGMWATQLALKLKLPINGIIKKTIFRQFCGGESLDEAANTAKALEVFKVGAILDYGVEGNEGEDAFDSAVPEFIKAIRHAASETNIPFISLKTTGFSRFSLMEKIHNGDALIEEEKEEWNRVHDRIDTICKEAAQDNVMVLIDAEETWIQEAVNQLANAAMERYNKNKAFVYNTFQLYTTGALPYLKKSFEEAKTKGYILGAKLVRGAYMEKERKRATDKGYTSPIHVSKQNTDNDYNEAVLFCLERLDSLSVFIGTHNETSCLKAVEYMEAHNISNNDTVWFSQLFGMSDNISFNLAHHGYKVAKYLPYGPIKDVMPYLMRRAQENTSVAGQTSRELMLINKELERRKN